MNAYQRHQLTSAIVQSSNLVMEKSASASPEQQDVLGSVWPDLREDGVSKIAKISQILAAGDMVEEAEASAG